MRLDGMALRRAEVVQVNKVIDQIWSDFDTETVQANEGMIQASYGPDAIELLVGGDDWVVLDRNEPGAVVYHCDCGTTWVASHALFELCARLAPEHRITWHETAQESEGDC